MSLIVLFVIVYVGLYVVLSVPSVQNKINETVCRETSGLLGGRVCIRHLSVMPFSEVILSGVSLDSPDGERCVSIEKVAAGIDLWILFTDRRIVLNYAEIIGLEAIVSQQTESSPFNIQFLIDALSPKDKSKPPTAFDLRIRNVVVRNSRARLLRPWMHDASGMKRMLADIELNRLRIDLNIPVLSNDLYRFDIRNIQFDASRGISVRSLSADVVYAKDTLSQGHDRLMVRKFQIGLPNTGLSVGDLNLRLDSLDDIDVRVDGHITPSDFKELMPELNAFDSQWGVDIAGRLKGRNLEVSEFVLDNSQTRSSLNIAGRVGNLHKKDSLDIVLERLEADLSSKLIGDVVSALPKFSEKAKRMAEAAGHVKLELEGSLHGGDRADAEGSILTDRGQLGFQASGTRLQTSQPILSLSAEADNIEVGRLLETDKVGEVSLNVDATVSGLDRNAEGHIHILSEECSIMGSLLTGLDLDLTKKKDDIALKLMALSGGMSFDLDGKASLAGKDTEMEASMILSGFNPSRFGMKGKMSDCDFSVKIDASTKGDNPDNITGAVDIRDLNISRPDGSRLKLDQLTVRLDTVDNQMLDEEKGILRDFRVNSDWIDARVSGHIHPSTVVREMKDMVGSVFPTLIPNDRIMANDKAENSFSFDIDIKGVGEPYVFFNVPVRPLSNIPIRGKVDSRQGLASLEISTPHLQQGRNKLIRDLILSLDVNAFLGMARINAGLIFPAKKGDAEIAADIYAMHDKVNVNIGLNPTLESVVKGNVAMSASFSRLQDPFNPQGKLAVRLDILPSNVSVNDKAWSIANGGINYSGKRISISNFMISHEDQFVKIHGAASESADDKVTVYLNDMDLEYIFNILNINYVSFGGMATGEIVGSRLLTKTPEAKTKSLRVKGLSYNGAVLGDGDLASDYDAGSQKVGIYAVVRDPLTRERRASIDGGIWVTRDSLSFGFDARKINVGIMKPFVSAFCSDLYGEASGKCKLYGTFSDIDLIGDLKADTLSMKLDFTNTWYHAGNDSVFLHKGLIEVPPLTLYDDEGHTAEFSGWLRHRYFHEPVFSFRLNDAKSLLCYDTNAQINPLWYGTIYGSGHAQINGNPGLIDIDMNMTTEEGSKFYYVLSDAEDVTQYSFLTFTDRSKEKKEAAATDSVPDYLKKFRKHTEEMDAGSSNVVLSLKGTVTNDAFVTLVMDPRAGDNITARGQGALQMDYNLANNDLRMIGTYVLDEGNYYFTLQDIIIKNFNIRRGSLIKFDGDPMKANLDITATYRVNTNLTDLDESFSTDRELNRTNVPVDAVLLVDGPMTNPDITFDIELPSLTSDVERKVKSIVSTNDMMSRQIIYLLALNRFYTPEYTKGQSSNGSEWSSMASSTISSQLSNILSQMTDKLSVSPSFRSDKGDFTDMEFDLALSSRLLNNRLLINGNFGYRDGSTSNTQFIGDFDIEYLLSKNGNLRLKAYNHFNDQNYYLRSALTTQGVGVVFQRDFDRLFGQKKNLTLRKPEETELQQDSIETADKKTN